MAAESVKNLPTTGLMDNAKTFSIGSSTASPDMSFAFDLNQPAAFEMASLSDVEMDETEGAWGWIAFVAAVVVASIVGNQVTEGTPTGRPEGFPNNRSVFGSQLGYYSDWSWGGFNNSGYDFSNFSNVKWNYY